MLIDRNKSLQELEGEDWGEPTFESHLVTECHRLRRVPLRELTAESLRLVIGQQIGLPHLIPIALELLRADPFTEGDYYRGDLLTAVLRVKATFWRDHPDLRREAAGIAVQAFALLPRLDEVDRQTTGEAISKAYDVFKKSEPTGT